MTPAGLVRSLAGVRGIDAESRRFLGVDMATGIADRLAAAWRQWRADLAEMVRSKPTFTDFDVILDCADRSRADLVRLISAAL